MDTRNLIEALFRWGHILAGVLWIGHLYFFNFVNSNFAPTMDGDTKKKVVPELMPRALFVFRWGAAWTWLTGLMLLGLVYYMLKPNLFESGHDWGVASLVMLAVVFLAFAVYDPLMKAIADTKVQAAVGFVLVVGVLLGLKHWAGFSFRGAAIHLGAMFGTLMAANVWMRIWPSQRAIITATKNGEKPDAAVVALAGQRSKHNTYMSVPLLFTMMAQHGFWAATYEWALPLVVLVAWAFTFWLYKKFATVKGF